MAAFVKFFPFCENLAEKLINLEADTLRTALTNTAPSQTDNGFLPGTSHPPPAAANGYATGGGTPTVSSSTQTGGTYKLVVTDVTFTATTGGIGPFRYCCIYSDTSTNDLLIGYHDYGSSITLAVGETFTVDYDGSAGLLTLA